eukprot:TRINITY_DN8806_c0_g1_i1.p1 TRINITY_DN8806_c0_g1~~TRINITY_DN8806_c0_g1_i1.p1  ORF type:complete len:679 (+),score=118.45 TRINITY_DN8806_c0_g1_i1:75-2111(+)
MECLRLSLPLCSLDRRRKVLQLPALVTASLAAVAEPSLPVATASGLDTGIRDAVAQLSAGLAPGRQGFELQVLASLGNQAYEQRDHALAIATFRQLLQESSFPGSLSLSDATVAVARYAESLLGLRAFGQASRWFRVALTLLQSSGATSLRINAPVEAYLYERLGDCYYKRLQWTQAAASYKSALESKRKVGDNAAFACPLCYSVGSGTKAYLVGDAVEVRKSLESTCDGSWHAGHVTVVHLGSSDASASAETGAASRDWGEMDLNEQFCYENVAHGVKDIEVGSICVIGGESGGRWVEWVFLDDLYPKPGVLEKLRRQPLDTKHAEVGEKLSLFDSSGFAAYAKLYMPPPLRDLWIQNNNSSGAADFQSRALPLLLASDTGIDARELFASNGAVAIETVLDRRACSAMASHLLRFRSLRSTRAWEVPPAFRNHSSYFVKSNVDRDHFVLSLDEGPEGGPTVGEFLRNALGSQRSQPLIKGLFSGESVLWELAAFVVHPGAEEQPLHADVEGEVEEEAPALVSEGAGTGQDVRAPKSITLQLLLSDAQPGQGGLTVWPGSHRPPRERGTSSSERRWAQRQAVVAAANLSASGLPPSPGVEMAPLQAGTLLAYHSHLWHRGGANLGPSPRVVLYASFLAGSSTALRRAADPAATRHHMALLPEYKQQRRTLADVMSYRS